LLEQPFAIYPLHVQKLPPTFGTDLIPVPGGFAVVARLQVYITQRITLSKWLVRGKHLRPETWNVPRCPTHPDFYCFNHSERGEVRIPAGQVVLLEHDFLYSAKVSLLARWYLVGFIPWQGSPSDGITLDVEFGARDLFGETHWFPLALTYHRASAST
jgi:hypothetical protein